MVVFAEWFRQNGVVVCLALAVIACVIACVWWPSISHDVVSYLTRKERYKSVTLGMPEREMLLIMGDCYSRSLLWNNRVKYEWRYSEGYSSGSSRHYGGVAYSSRSYHGVQKVYIYVRDGHVEEVRPYNM